MSGGIAVVGAPGTGEDNEYRGAVYLFRWHESTWQFHLRIEGPEERASRRYGHAVAIEGRTVVVGDPVARFVHVVKLSESLQRDEGMFEEKFLEPPASLQGSFFWWLYRIE